MNGTYDVVSGYAIVIGFSWVDGLSTDPLDFRASH